MPRTSRQRRGQATASLVAAYLQPLAPGATATPSAYSGNDIQGVPWDVEVKAPREESWKHVKPGAGSHAIAPDLDDPERCATCGGRIRRASFSPGAALRQACKRRKPEHILPPMVVLRPDGTGDASVGEFIVMRRFEDDREILEELLQLRWLRDQQTRELAELRGLDWVKDA